MSDRFPAPPEADLSPLFTRERHISYCLRNLRSLPQPYESADCSRMTLAYFALSALSLLGALEERTTKEEREAWREWVWACQIPGSEGGGFRSSPFMGTPADPALDPCHLAMTYSALQVLALLRDPLDRLDRRGILRCVRERQRPNGSFESTRGAEADVRMCYCAAAICSMLGDWEGVDRERLRSYVESCRTYEGGYAQSPNQEAQGGTTYCALTTLSLLSASPAPLSSPFDRSSTLRWLLQRQLGGFQGRTNKVEDSCYSFWVTGALAALGPDALDLVDQEANARWLVGKCQFVAGGFVKFPPEYPDVLHNYMSLAALALSKENKERFGLKELDPSWNLDVDTRRWLEDWLWRGVESRP